MKTKIVWMLIGIVAFSCEAKSDSRSYANFQSPDELKSSQSDTLLVDIEKSIIYWKGTKMRGLGKHEGTINLKSGFLIKSAAQIVGGEFVIDMESIAVTDISEYETIPIRNLINHLKSADFFNVDQFPEAQFLIISSEDMQQDKSMLHGALTIRGMTYPASIEVNKNKNGYHANIILDRFKWNIAYEGSWVDRTLVDCEMILSVDLKLE